MPKPSEVSGPTCPGSCSMPPTMTRSATASRHTRPCCATWPCRRPTRPWATPCTPHSSCSCLSSRLSFLELWLLLFCLFRPHVGNQMSVLPSCTADQVLLSGWWCQASARPWHRDGAGQNLQQAGSWELVSCCWNVRHHCLCGWWARCWNSLLQFREEQHNSDHYHNSDH